MIKGQGLKLAWPLLLFLHNSARYAADRSVNNNAKDDAERSAIANARRAQRDEAVTQASSECV